MSRGKVGPPEGSIVETEIDECVALFNPRSGQALVLNATASDIWRLSDGDMGPDELTATLARAYGVDAGSIGAEVGEAISLLRKDGFLPPDGG